MHIKDSQAKLSISAFRRKESLRVFVKRITHATQTKVLSAPLRLNRPQTHHYLGFISNRRPVSSCRSSTRPPIEGLLMDVRTMTSGLIPSFSRRSPYHFATPQTLCRDTNHQQWERTRIHLKHLQMAPQRSERNNAHGELVQKLT